MASPAQAPKVLRIGIVVGGKIIAERLVKHGETVSVGTSAKCTFALPGVPLPRAEWPLFDVKDGRYHLAFTDAMHGKIGAAGAVVGLDKLRDDPTVERRGDVWRLPLTDADRGKVTIGNATVLFQFVSPPPTSDGKGPRADFRPRLLEEDDALLFVFTVVFGTGAAMAVLLAVFFLPPEEEPVSIGELPDKWNKLIIARRDPPPQPETPVETGDTPDTPEPEVVAEAPAPEPRRQVDPAATRDRVVAESALLSYLTTYGPSASGTRRDLFSSESGVLEAAKSLEGVGRVVDADDTRGPRGELTGPGEAEDIDDLRVVDRKQDTTIEDAPTVALSVSAGEGEAEDLPEPQQDAIKKVVQKHAAQLKYCYEQELKANPGLGGRVEVTWQIGGGRVTGVQIYENTTGDSELAECVAGKVKRWTGFPADAEGEVQWPFIFKQKG